MGFIGWEEEHTFYANEGELVTVFWSNVGPSIMNGYRIATQEAISSQNFHQILIVKFITDNLFHMIWLFRFIKLN